MHLRGVQRHSSLTHTHSVAQEGDACKCVCDLELKPPRPPTCLTVCLSTKEKQTTKRVDKVAQRKANPSRHLKVRLIQPLPLRAAQRNNQQENNDVQM